LRKGFSDILVRIIAIASTPIRSLRQQQQKTPEQALVLHKLYTRTDIDLESGQDDDCPREISTRHREPRGSVMAERGTARSHGQPSQFILNHPVDIVHSSSLHHHHTHHTHHQRHQRPPHHLLLPLYLQIKVHIINLKQSSDRFRNPRKTSTTSIQNQPSIDHFNFLKVY
ncbi:hypothetical protein KC19_VG107900, partial [Ceratodon purpureus]